MTDRKGKNCKSNIRLYCFLFACQWGKRSPLELHECQNSDTWQTVAEVGSSWWATNTQPRQDTALQATRGGMEQRGEPPWAVESTFASSRGWMPSGFMGSVWLVYLNYSMDWRGTETHHSRVSRNYTWSIWQGELFGPGSSHVEQSGEPGYSSPSSFSRYQDKHDTEL